MTGECTSRVVVIGASNVARSGSVVLRAAEAAFSGPLDILLAAGHGRALGLTSRVLGRVLPPTLECGLWEALQARRPLPTHAVVTDIGNDLVFGAPPQRVLGWVEEVVERLKRFADRLVMTRLPIASVTRMNPRMFRCFRTVFFPSSQLTYEDAQRGAQEIDEGVAQLARNYPVTLVEPDADWYGWDPIHVVRTQQKQLWKKIFSALSDEKKHLPVLQRSIREECLLRLRFPQERWLFGWHQSGQQPCFETCNHSRVSLY